MRRLIRILFSFVLVAVAAGECRAGEAVAAELAGLIDQQIDARLSSEGVRASELADDAEFVRRIYLDLHGTVPTLEQVKRFLADAEPNKRARLIDSLLADARYGQYLADLWQGYLISPLWLCGSRSLLRQEATAGQGRRCGGQRGRGQVRHKNIKIDVAGLWSSL